MASDFSYTSVPNSLRKFLKGVPNRGVPAKVNVDHLKSIGLREGNDSSIVRPLKFVGLLKGDGSPTDAYKEFRDKNKGPTVLATEIRRAYRELFETYPDAYSQTDESLRNFFSAKTSVGKAAISFMVGTFKALCEFGDFSLIPSNAPGASPSHPPQPGAGGSKTAATEVHVNFQIHLPADATPAAYDAIFEAMVRRLGKLI